MRKQMHYSHECACRPSLYHTWKKLRLPCPSKESERIVSHSESFLASENDRSTSEQVLSLRPHKSVYSQSQQALPRAPEFDPQQVLPKKLDERLLSSVRPRLLKGAPYNSSRVQQRRKQAVKVGELLRASSQMGVSSGW